LSLIGAAVVYAPTGPTPLTFSVPSTPLQEYTLAFILASIAFFVLGLGLVLYAKSEKLGFFLVVVGSLALFIAAFAYGYRTDITELVFGYVPLTRAISPYREYALPIAMASAVLLVVGYAFLVRKSLIANEIRGFHDRKLMPRRLGSLSFVMILGVAAVLIGVVAEVATIFYPNDMLRFVAGPISIVGVDCLLAALAGVWSRGKTSRSIRKALVGGLLLLTLSLALAYSSAKTVEIVLPPNIYDREKVEMGPVTFDSANPNTLLVNVTNVSDWNESITFSNALINNASGGTVANVELGPYILPAQYLTEKTLTIVLGTILPSGEYTVILITTSGNTYISPSFTVP
jgi:hypothetical protein